MVQDLMQLFTDITPPKNYICHGVDKQQYIELFVLSEQLYLSVSLVLRLRCSFRLIFNNQAGGGIDVIVELLSCLPIYLHLHFLFVITIETSECVCASARKKKVRNPNVNIRIATFVSGT